MLDRKFLVNYLKIEFEKKDKYYFSILNDIPFIYLEINRFNSLDYKKELQEIVQDLRQRFPSAYIWIYFTETMNILVTRAFGENKFLLFNDTWSLNSDYIRSIHEILDSLNPDSFDSLFRKDVTYELFFRNIEVILSELASNIIQTNSIDENDAFLIAKKMINRIVFIFFLCEKDLIKRDSGELFSGRELLERFFEYNSIFELDFENSFFKNKIPSIMENLFKFKSTHGTKEFRNYSKVKLNNIKFNWNVLFDFLDTFLWVSNEEIPNFIKINQSTYLGILTPGIFEYIYEHSAENKYKNSGMYYTPEEITKYINKTTIFPYIRDKFNRKFNCNGSTDFKDFLNELSTDNKEIIAFDCIKDKPEQLNYLFTEILMKIRICDIACGSGAFLTSALDILVFLFRECIMKLKEIDEISGFNKVSAKMISTNCLFGIDIQGEAIKIVKLRFFLYLLDNSISTETIGEYIDNLNHRFLSGNSIIGITTSDENANTNYENSPFLDLLNTMLLEKYRNKNLNIDESTIKKLKPIHYPCTFPEIFLPTPERKQTGFDIIIGNPPYIENKKMKGDFINKSIQKTDYISAYKQYDYSVLFIERAWYLLKDGGYLSYIITNKFCASDYGIKIRRFILENTEIVHILDVSNIDVFKKAATYPIIFNCKKSQNKSQAGISIKDGLDEKIMEASINELSDLSKDRFNKFFIPQKVYNSIPGSIFTLSSNLLIAEKIRNSKNISPLTELGGNNMKYRLFGFTGYPEILSHVLNNPPADPNHKYYKFIGTKNLRPFAVDEDITFSSHGYNINHGYLGYKKEYNGIWNYFGRKKLLIKEVSKKLIVSYDSGIYANLTGMYMFIPENNGNNNSSSNISIFYMLGLLNSRLIDFIYKVYYENVHMAGGYLNIHKSYLALLPIKIPTQIQLKTIEFTAKILYILAKLKNSWFNQIYILLNYLIYELYFIEEIGNDLTKLVLSNIFEIKNLNDFNENLDKIEKFHEDLFSNQKFLQINEELLKNNETIKTIEEFYK